MSNRKRTAKFNCNSDLAGARILILTGEFKGREGVCLGQDTDSESWAVSPLESNKVLNLKFEKEFVLLLDLSGKGKNN